MPKLIDAATNKIAFRRLSTTNVSGPPPLSILKGPLIPRASDGSLLTVQYDPAGTLISAEGIGVDGRHHEVTFTGDWPNQHATFTEEAEEFFYASSYLEQIPVQVTRLGRSVSSTLFYFYFTLSNTKLDGLEPPLHKTSVSYEVIPADAATLFTPGDWRPFAAVKWEPFQRKSPKGVTQTLWHPTAAARGVFEFQTSSFPWMQSLDAASVGFKPGDIFWTKTRPLDWDITLEANFKDEVTRASYFGGLFAPLGPPSPPVLFDLTVKKFLLHMLSWCLGGAAGGLIGGGVGSAFGCLGGAIGSGLSDIVDIVTSPPSGQASGGGIGAQPVPGGQAPTGDSAGVGGTPTVDDATKKKRTKD